MFGQLFDERFRSAAVGVNAYAPFRVMLGSAVGAFVGLGAGWTVAAIWVLAAVLGEVAMFIATRAVIRAEKPSNRWLWLCAGVYALTFLPWSAAGIILWSADSQACPSSPGTCSISSPCTPIRRGPRCRRCRRSCCPPPCR